MHEIVEDIERGLDAGVYYLALFAALSIPDICGAIDSPDGMASQLAYTRWFDRFVAPKYGGLLTGLDCYHFRCGLLHQGTMQPQSQRIAPRYKQIVFSDPNVATFLISQVNDGVLNIDVRFFCQDVVNGVREWLTLVELTERYKNNIKRCVRFYGSRDGNPDGGLSYVG